MTVADGQPEHLAAHLETAPDDFCAWMELARWRNASHQAREALEAANNALTLHPSSLEALYERGLAQLELGQASEAAGAFTSILAVQPLHPGVLVSLGWAYYQLRLLDQAGLIWEQAVRVASEPVEILENLAVCYQRLGDFPKVATVWERVLLLQPSHPLALHHLAALGQRPFPERCSDEYLVKLFNEFAEEYDATLASLGYDGPRLLAEFVAKSSAVVPRACRILDLGCGTGLCAPLVRPWAAWLEGVDLSPGMLESAKARGLYDALHRAEMSEFCAARPEAFDLVFAADSIIYFGSLGPLARSVAGSLRHGGLWAFYLERMEEEGSAPGFRLERHGRYSHQPQYVADCLAATGFALLASSDAVVRSERGRPVRATLFLGQRP